MSRSRQRLILLLPLMVCMTGLTGGCGLGLIRVPNPSYKMWEAFAPGSYVTFEGVNTVGKAKAPQRVTMELVAKYKDKLIFKRTTEPLDGPRKNKPYDSPQEISATIDPWDHPLTNLFAKYKKLEAQEITIAGKTFLCKGRQTEVHAKLEGFVDNKQDLLIQAWRHPDIPGRVVKISWKTKTLDHTSEAAGQVVAYKVVREKDK